MWKKEGSGWDAPCIVASWKEHGFSLDELNEVVNFYFEINKPSVKCKKCGGNGHHPDAQWITKSWYSHSSPFTNQTAEEVNVKRFLERFGCENRPPLLGRGKMPPDELIEKYGLPSSSTASRRWRTAASGAPTSPRTRPTRCGTPAA